MCQHYWDDQISNKMFQMKQNNYKINTHKDCYNHILDTFNINDIKFVIIRGFK